LKPKIVVIGSANTDMIVKVAHLPGPGETVLGGEYRIAQGGKGANQAVAAARLGANVIFIARLGRDGFGEKSIEAYRVEGLNTEYIIQDDNTHSGVALINVDSKGENQIAVASGANARLSPKDIKPAETAIKNADYLLLQLEIPLETVEATVDLANKYGVRVILNPAPAAELPAHILREIDTLTPNEKEAAILIGESSSGNPSDVAMRLQQKNGIKNLVITLGSKGAIIAGSKTIKIPAYKVKPIDSTGAGDAFNGGLAVALAKGIIFEDAVRYANAVGALCTTRQGAQSSMPTEAEVAFFLKKNPDL
jgi:ribokinase